MYRKTAKKLLKFIEKSPTAFQAVTEMTKRLDKEGFEELKEEDHWKLKKGGNYYVTRNHSAIIAFPFRRSLCGSFILWQATVIPLLLRSRRILR